MAESVKKRSEIEEQDTWKLEDMIESPEKFEELMDGVEERNMTHTVKICETPPNTRRTI